VSAGRTDPKASLAGLLGAAMLVGGAQLMILVLRWIAGS